MQSYRPSDELILKIYALADDLKEEEQKLIERGMNACNQENDDEALRHLAALSALIGAAVGTIIIECLPEDMVENLLKTVKVMLPAMYENRRERLKK